LLRLNVKFGLKFNYKPMFKHISGITLFWLMGLLYAQAPREGFAQYSFKFKINGLKDTVCYLGFNFGDKKFLRDTARVNSKGEVEFSPKTSRGKKDPMLGGVYLLILPDKARYFEFLVNEPNIHIETDTADFYKRMVVKQSEENKIFLSYLLNIDANGADIQKFRTIMEDETASEAEKKKAREGLEKINETLLKFRRELAEKHPQTFASALFRAMEEPNLAQVDTADKEKTYRYFKAHYFDGFDIRDNRMLRTPFYEQKLTFYFEKLVPQIADSLIAEADQFIGKLAGDKELFKFVVHKLTFMFERSQVMCVDRAFVHMVETYYRTGRADWLNKEDLDKVLERSEKLRPVLCGEIVKDINLPDTSGKVFHSLYKTQGKYKILYFWDATCGHCKKATPALGELYLSFLKPNNIAVFAVEGEIETKEWKKFLQEHKLPFVTVSDFPEMRDKPELYVPRFTDIGSVNFRHNYDLRSYPVMFVLDQNHKIVGKGLSVEQLEDFLKKLMSQDEKKK
jgi:peroxiredoxin